MIYVGMTVIEIVAYRIAGMNWFDATCHSFTTLATGGFSTQNASLGSYDSRWIDIITIVFMVLAGTNFGLYYAAFRGKLKVIWSDPEFRFYIFLLTAGSAVVIFALLGSGEPLISTTGAIESNTIGNTITQGVFTVVSQQSTTGFCTTDFDRWPFVAKAVIILLMFVGGCAGSTGGGIKVIRIYVAFKVMLGELERAFRPHVVRPLKVGKLMLLESGNPKCDFTTAATASVATICTVGPGLAKIGATQNYEWFSDASKLLLCVLMAIGRLEIFAVLVLFTPRFWRSS